jgi:hypothetical protein
MGDVLNTREMVSVQSLSAATRFFDQLSQIAPVHVILGYNPPSNGQGRERGRGMNLFIPYTATTI